MTAKNGLRVHDLDWETALDPRTGELKDVPVGAVRGPAPVRVLRLPSGKLVPYVREGGLFRPFLMRSVETGFWDGRYLPPERWGEVFADLRAIEANTINFMVSWFDVEPERDQYDWTVTDRIVELGREYEIKVVVVFFFHYHKGGVSRCLGRPKESAPWLFSDDANIQWGFDTQGNLLRSYAAISEEVFPCLGSPFVVERMANVLARLAERYRDSDVILGYQVGNEIGFDHGNYRHGYLPDANPLTVAALREYERRKFGDIASLNREWGTNFASFGEIVPWKVSDYDLWFDFRKDVVVRAYNAAIDRAREIEPYKPYFLNLFWHAEAGDKTYTGTDATTYRDVHCDAIAAMMYSFGPKNEFVLEAIQRVGIDIVAPAEHLLMTTELDSGWNRGVTPHDWEATVWMFLRRGGQGYAIYDWGHLTRPFFTPGRLVTDIAAHVLEIAETLQPVERVLLGGVPVDDLVAPQTAYRFTTEEPDVGLVTLKPAPESPAMLALAYPADTGGQIDLRLVAQVPVAGEYEVTAYAGGGIWLDERRSAEPGTDLAIAITLGRLERGEIAVVWVRPVE